MESQPLKFYHIHGMNSRHHLETYLANRPDMIFTNDFIKFPLESLQKAMEKGHVQGGLLIDLSFGSIIHHLHLLCDFFKDIILLRFDERCIMEIRKWLGTHTGAFDWMHASAITTELQGISEESEEKELKLKKKIKNVIKCDLEKENPTHPVQIPKADCIVATALVEAISKDKDDYIRNLRKILCFLKPEGHLILLELLNTTYFTVGKDLYHMFSYNEAFIRKVLDAEGFTIDHCEVHKRTAEGDLLDYDGVIVLVAHRRV